MAQLAMALLPPYNPPHGEVAERLKVAVSKTVVV